MSKIGDTFRKLFKNTETPNPYEPYTGDWYIFEVKRKFGDSEPDATGAAQDIKQYEEDEKEWAKEGKQPSVDYRFSIMRMKTSLNRALKFGIR